MNSDLVVKFWGVRGSTPTPQRENLGFGGNTSCVEVRSGSDSLILDAGTGLRMLGRALAEEARGESLNLHLFLTHFHWDHIQGIPFFGPGYDSNNLLTYYCGHPEGNLEDTLNCHMATPYFPVQFRQMVASRDFCHMGHQLQVRIGSLTVHSFPLNHPQGASGYRIESPAGVIIYATDTEHGEPRVDRTLRDFAQGADVMIYDAQYTPEEYASHRGWGHSTWLEGSQVARDAGVKNLVLFHHDPWHDDDMCRTIVKTASTQFENTTAAAEGTTIRVSRSEGVYLPEHGTPHANRSFAG